MTDTDPDAPGSPDADHDSLEDRIADLAALLAIELDSDNRSVIGDMSTTQLDLFERALFSLHCGLAIVGGTAVVTTIDSDPLRARPVFSVGPTITGTGSLGQTLTAHAGTYSNSAVDDTITYSWERATATGWKRIIVSGNYAVGTTYEVTQDDHDAGHVRVREIVNAEVYYKQADAVSAGKAIS